MALAVKQIIENSNDTEEIKGFREQFPAIQQSLEEAFQFQDALPPEEALRELLSIYDLYLHIESVSSSLYLHIESVSDLEAVSDYLKIFNSLEELEHRLEEFKIKYKEFAPKEAVDGIEELQLWTKIYRTMMNSKAYMLVASFEDDEVRQLGLFYTGLIDLLDVAENHLSFFTKKGCELAKALAKTVISYKPFEDYAKKRPADEITSQAIGIRNAAKAILWEIDSYERENKKSEPLSWEEEEKFIDMLIEIGKTPETEYTREEIEAFERVLEKLNKE